MRRALLIAIAVCLALSTWTSIVGGIQFQLAGVTLRSRDPIRPLTLAVVFLLVYGIAFRSAFTEQTRRFEDAIARHGVWIAVVCALVVTWVSVRWSTYAASGSDSYGYVSEAYGWLYGPLPRPIPLAASLPWPSAAASLAPFGYTPAPAAQGIVPTYSPGLPLMMAVFLWIAGPRGPYLVVPVFAGLIVWATFVLGKRVAGAGAATLGVLFVAVSPIVIFQSLWPMTDVPIGALWTAAAAAALSDSRRAAVFAGLSAAVAVVVRPNLPLLPAVFVVHFVLTAQTWREGVIRALVFGLLVAPAVVGVAILNSMWFGGAFHSGYGTAGTLYSAHSIWPNLQRYPVWLVRSHSMLSALFVLPLVMWKRSGANAAGLRLAYLLIAATWISYLPYYAFEEWWYLRFLLPAIPAMLVLCAVAILTIGRLIPRPWNSALTLVLATALFVPELQFTRAKQMLGPLYLAEQRYVTVGLYLRRVMPANGLVFAIQHSGSLRFYTGRPTVRYDVIDEDWVARAPAAAMSAGYHPYAVFEDPEMPQVRSLMGVGANAPLPWRLIARLDHPVGLTVYDLAPEGDPRMPVALAIGDGHRAVRAAGY